MIDKEQVNKVTSQALSEIQAAVDIKVLDNIRVRFLGKKGQLNLLLKQLGSLPSDERRTVGAALNEGKKQLEAAFSDSQAKLALESSRLREQSEAIDVTLPVDTGIPLHSSGTLHPNTLLQSRLEQIFRGLGFTVVDGPEVEKEYYNFEALNIPSSHPARDMQDTFWTKDGNLLRTHTSSIQVRALERMKPPLRIVAPGRVFRYERLDASHENTFYQMEGMMIDRKVTVGNLIYFMRTLLREIFGFDPRIRLRPGYFPFVEPGFELDIWFKEKWMELLPCGLIHPRVLEFGGIDPREWQGFAFGLGLSRLVMSRFGIDDIRYLQSGDLKFLKQFVPGPMLKNSMT